MTSGSGIPAHFEPLIRARGAVLDMPFTQSLYQPLLAQQRRDGVAVTRDIVYGADERHRLDVYRAEESGTSPLPVMIFMHGGGFIRGDKADKENYGQYFARHGFLVLVPNYRLAPAHRWPAGAEDVVRAYGWARDHAGEFGGDPARIFLIGESAGAAHVALATLVQRFHPPGGMPLAGVVLISGVYDVQLEGLARRQFGIATPDPRNDAYFGSDPASYGQMSTIRLIDSSPFPLLITYAELDLLQMQVQAGALFTALVTHQRFEPDLRVIRGHNHLTQVYSINTGDESLSQWILKFVLEHMPAAGEIIP